MKTHAKEYLIEFSTGEHCSNWMKYLIYQVININNPITELDIDLLVNNISEKKQFVFPSLANNTVTTQQDIRLVSLKHVSGVNALAENQTIKFHDNVTILNGLNGSGKSSYFRILNEMVGGNEQREIIPNIYSETKKDVAVELKYKLGNIEKSLKWNNTKRGIQDLSRCRVFDSSYLNGLLDVRKVDETLVYPLGLNLFSYVATSIDNLKSKFKDLSLAKKNEKPQIDFSNLTEEIKNAFLSNKVSSDIKSKIENMYIFTPEQEEQFEKVCKDIKQLEQTNIEDKISLRKGEIDSYQTFCSSLKTASDSLKAQMKNTKNLIDEYKQKKEANVIAKNKFEVLKSIPKNDSLEWKKFISYGEKYMGIIESENKCPYCRQKLDNDARSLIRAYGEFLLDNTEKELEIVEEKIQKEIRDIQQTNFNLSTNTNIDNFLSSKTIKGKPAVNCVSECISTITSQKNTLIDLLTNIDCKTELKFDVDVSSIIDLFTDEIDSINNTIASLSKEQTEKQKKIAELENERKLLLENKEISKQKDLFIKWFEKDKIEKEFETIASSLTTKEITSLSNKAYGDLLTDTLRTKFEEELKALGKENIKVNLLKESGIKGSLNTKLTLVNNYDLKSILSEGEQKAVGLALFLAEVKSQNLNNPIILDDPVNSLDHQIAGKFAERLLQLDNQIIIFNHNRLFLTAFETTLNGHICKTIDTACNKVKGKHIRVYSVQDEGKKSKGVLVQYQCNTAEYYLREASQLLSQSPFKEWDKIAVSIRECVEHCIDEIIFNRQVPTCFSTKTSRINWEELKKIQSDADVIEKLHNIHDRVSGGKIHNGLEATENPVSIDEYREFVSDLENILKK